MTSIESSAISSQFARLVPDNHAARTEFSRVVSRLHPLNSIQKQFHPACFVEYHSGHDAEPASGVNRTALPPDLNTTLWTGHYNLDYNFPPQNVYLGWTIGRGHFNERQESSDILLSDRAVRGDLGYCHFAITHNYGSGGLMICAFGLCTVTLDGTDSFQNNQRLLYKKRTSIEIGDLKYILAVNEFSDEEHSHLLDNYSNENQIDGGGHPVTLNATPSKLDQVTERYVIKNPIGDGVTGVVHAGLDRYTGNAVAIKRFRRTAGNASTVEYDKDMGRLIGNHPNICKLADVLEPIQKSYDVFGFDELLFVYSPLADWTMERLLSEDTYVATETCIMLFREYLTGLAFLHSKGIMHRDIKPSNLTILSLKAARGQLIDFGDAIHVKADVVNRNKDNLVEIDEDPRVLRCRDAHQSVLLDGGPRNFGN